MHGKMNNLLPEKFYKKKNGRKNVEKKGRRKRRDSVCDQYTEACKLTTN
jgi:hypothetical protein